MNTAWSKKWSHLEYDQFLIGNEDFSKWVIIDKESCVFIKIPATSKRFKLFQVELLGSDNNKYYDKQPIKVMASSSTCDPHTSKKISPAESEQFIKICFLVKMTRRNGQTHEPHIGLRDHGLAGILFVLYLEYNNGGHLDVLQESAMRVYTRKFYDL